MDEDVAIKKPPTLAR